MKEISEIIIYLLNKDKKLSYILDKNIECPILKQPRLNNNNLFRNLSRSIVGQQLSNKAAASIWKKLNINIKTPKEFINKILKINISQAKKIGISRPKLIYIKEIAKKVNKNQFVFSKLANLSNEDAIKKLTELKGVGVWTAEMFLIFELKRQNIFAFEDAGLRRAIKLLYNISELSDNQLKRITNKWSPHKSIVSWYLWRALDSKKLNDI